MKRTEQEQQPEKQQDQQTAQEKPTKPMKPTKQKKKTRTQYDPLVTQGHLESMRRSLFHLNQAVQEIASDHRHRTDQLRRIYDDMDTREQYEIRMKRKSHNGSSDVEHILGPIVVHAGCIEFFKIRSRTKHYVPFDDLIEWSVIPL